MSLESRPEWADLLRLPESASIARLFASDPERARRFSWRLGDLLVDLSKHRWDDDVKSALVSIARAVGVERSRDRLFVGDRLNVSEDRPVGHLALRVPVGERAVVDGRDVSDDVSRVRRRTYGFASGVRDGLIVSSTGERFTDVVNIGIGGSDLGPAMAHRALRARRLGGPRVHFVSNVDPAASSEIWSTLDPRRTLVVVSSKTMTTVETLANFRAARTWLSRALGERALEHVVAVTADPGAARELGVDDERIFEFWDWVGGRYSLASSIGLSLVLAVGPEAFDELLAGMRTVDEHVRDSSLDDDVPLLMALLGVLYVNKYGAETKAIVPYSSDLARLPAYVQQLDMESNGKSVHLDGRPVIGATGPIVWGEPGTDAQHAFFQLLHQGTHLVPVDFIGFARPAAPSDLIGDDDRHDRLLDNLLAQSRALAFGRPAHETALLDQAEHRVFPGDRPNTVIIAPQLTPSVLGQLIALYEWVVFFQGCIWGVNSFDQWGVELGKSMANDRATGDSSTSMLRDQLRHWSV
ncbi:MAG: glucose-6-phosphate isomerase [Ilumatobacteraceae bacterium]